MSFKNFSVSHPTPNNDTPEDKTKAAPAVSTPVQQPAKKQDEAAPTRKP